ncbi:MAG: hypothetical protein RBR87_03750 [Bacteroidales bacterium]|jgi:hypothetical protein|nr:hypothetical protein [Bacteroidales bacterium]
MQKGLYAVIISQQTKNEAFRACENLVDDSFDDQIDNSGLVAKLQIVGNELIDTIYSFNSKPEFNLGLDIKHEGVGFFIQSKANEFECLSMLFNTENTSPLSLKMSLIADEILIDESDYTIRFIFESNSLNRELSNSRIKTLKKYLEPDQKSKLKTHDSF